MRRRDAGLPAWRSREKVLTRTLPSGKFQPRDFVRTKTYFGPDRRRSLTSTYAGPDRRKGGKADVIRQQALLDKAKMPA